ncbi:SpoIIE family protein phosphatase [Sphingomonas adhaesiva]|uniref:SpoIIE family protein phosphatase n=1 Tax=Sphingomonas adhaesiva TaxID=28212 RepID=UPI002FFACD71
MHLDLIQTLSLCGDPATPNDDRAGATATRAWVIDGATDLGPPGLLGDQGGAAWLAAAADAAFGASGAADLAATCGEVFARVAARFAAERRRELLGAWELPSAAFVAAQLVDGALEVAWAADCALLHRSADGAVQWVTPVPNRARESADAAALGAGVVRTPAVLADRRRARERAGRRVLGVDAAASAAVVSTARVAVAPGDALLLMSDGFSALVDAYGAYDAAALFAAVATKGLAALAVELRAIEREDAACARFPRFKTSDDATALWVRVG